MIPAIQFRNWQWAALTQATPVVTWGAWPFHRATWANLRHGAATMDTLISLGTTVSYLRSPDKTGTVTTGRMSVTDIHPAPGVDVEQLLRYAGAVEDASEHPIARAIADAATQRLGQLPAADAFHTYPGLGAMGTVDATRVIIGRAA
jgi:cation transport ATPase